ncbi:DMT family transporter [Chloroflexota bacterium]
METGLFFALLAALTFGITNVLIRKGVYHAGETFTATLISILIGVGFFAFLVLVTEGWRDLIIFSWQDYLKLGIAGVIHLVLGRRFAFTCFRLIGANRASAILRSQMLYPVVLGIIILYEPLTIYLVLGFLCLVIGATLVSIEKKQKLPTDDNSKQLAKGIAAGLAGGLFWGISGVIVKPIVEQVGSPFAAAFVSYAGAVLVMASLLVTGSQREQLIHLNRDAIVALVAGGLFSAVAILLKYTALIHSPVSLVEPIIATSGIFVFLLSFLLNRSIEVMTWRVFLGILFATTGAFLFFQ